jgi:hypothetical protein
MSSPTRLVYLTLNLAYGVSIGTAAALWTYQAGAWSGRPSGALLAAGALVIFGTAYIATVTARGQRPTLRGALTVAGAAASVFALSTLAVTAPGWVLVWTAAAIAGLVVGVLAPLPPRRRPDA